HILSLHSFPTRRSSDLWGFLFVIVACVVIALSNITPKFKEDLNIKIIEDKVAFEQTKVIEVHKEQIYQGNLVLVNSEHPVHEDRSEEHTSELQSRENLV